MSNTLSLLVSLATLIGAVGGFIFALSRFFRRLDQLLELPTVVKNLSQRLETVEGSIRALNQTIQDDGGTANSRY